MLANPPFAGSLDYENTAKDLLADRQDQEDRAAVPRAVPAAAQARRTRGGDRARRRAVRLEQGAQGAAPDAGRGPEARRRRVKLPGGVFKPYAGVSTAILLFTKTNSGGTDHVWFYDVRRRRLEPRRQAHAAAAGRQARAGAGRALTADEHAKNNLPDVLARWASATATSASGRGPSRASACPRPTSPRRATTSRLNRYKEVVHEEVEHRSPLEILADLEKLEEEIQQGMTELKAMLRMTVRCPSVGRPIRRVARFNPAASRPETAMSDSCESDVASTTAMNLEAAASAGSASDKCPLHGRHVLIRQAQPCLAKIARPTLQRLCRRLDILSSSAHRHELDRGYLLHSCAGRDGRVGE